MRKQYVRLGFITNSKYTIKSQEYPNVFWHGYERRELISLVLVSKPMRYVANSWSPGLPNAFKEFI